MKGVDIVAQFNTLATLLRTFTSTFITPKVTFEEVQFEIGSQFKTREYDLQGNGFSHAILEEENAIIYKL